MARGCDYRSLLVGISCGVFALFVIIQLFVAGSGKPGAGENAGSGGAGGAGGAGGGGAINTKPIVNSRLLDLQSRAQLEAARAENTRLANEIRRLEATVALGAAVGGGGGAPLILQPPQPQQQQCICPPHPLAQPSPPMSPANPPAVSGGGGSSSGSGGGGMSIDQLLTEYCDLHRRIISGSSSSGGSGGSDKRQFIIATPQAQMNNRLRVIVSALLIGVLTKRAVLVEFSSGYYANLDDLFAMPIDIDLRHFDQSKLRASGGGVDINFNDPNQLLRQWFGSEDTIYRSITNYFLRPNAQVVAMRDAHIQKYWKRDQRSVVIGIHLRLGGDMRPQPVPESEWNDIRDCIEAVAQPYQKIMASGSEQKRPIVWFIAADTQESRDYALKLFASPSSPQHPARELAVFHDSVKRSNNPDGVRLAFTELMLLSACDHLVLTPASSFGEQAMAISGKPAYYAKSIVPQAAQISYATLHEVRPRCLRTHTSLPSIDGFSKMIENSQCFHPDMATLNF